jgi:hypothetical protein
MSSSTATPWNANAHFSFVVYFLKECLFDSIFNNVLEEGVFEPLAQGLRLFCGLITLWKKLILRGATIGECLCRSSSKLSNTKYSANCFRSN